MTQTENSLLKKYIDNCVKTNYYTLRQVALWDKNQVELAIEIQNNIDSGVKFNPIQGETYDNIRQGKLKIIELGDTSVRVLFYTGYNRKPQKVNLMIDELYRLCGGALI